MTLTDQYFPFCQLSETGWREIVEWTNTHYDILAQVKQRPPPCPWRNDLEITDLPYERHMNLLCFLVSRGVVEVVLEYLRGPRPATTYSLATEDRYPYGKYPVHYAIEYLERVFQFKYDGPEYARVIRDALTMIVALLEAERNELVIRDAQDRLSGFYHHVFRVEDPTVWKLWGKLLDTHLLPKFPEFSLRVLTEALDSVFRCGSLIG